MIRKNKIIMSIIIATILLAIDAIAYATTSRATSGNNDDILIGFNIDENSNIQINDIEEILLEKKIAEEMKLSDLKNYFDIVIYLPTRFPYDMECFEVRGLDMGVSYLANVDYCSSDKQKYILSTIQPAEKTEDEYKGCIFEDGVFEQNEVLIDDCSGMLYSFVSEGLVKAFLIKEGMLYQFTGNLTTDEVITIVESMVIAH